MVEIDFFPAWQNIDRIIQNFHLSTLNYFSTVNDNLPFS